MQRVEDVVLEQLLVADPDLDGLAGWAVLTVPGLDQGNVQRSPATAGAQVERPGRPQQSDAVGRVVTVQRAVLYFFLNKKCVPSDLRNYVEILGSMHR